MNQGVLIAFQLITLIFSIMVHEIAHGFTALKLGDTTARDQGRLTLNPLRHLDPFGSVILPIMLILFQSPILIGWAKPVPYNPHNLKGDPQKGAALIGAAGPLSNIAIALVFGIILRIIIVFANPAGALGLVILLNIVVFINILLAIFNLIPIPPLDGSSILFALLPPGAAEFKNFLTRYGFIILLFFVFSPLFQNVLGPVVFGIHSLIVGSGTSLF
jgi:Zn-dependent protease